MIAGSGFLPAFEFTKSNAYGIMGEHTTYKEWEVVAMNDDLRNDLKKMQRYMRIGVLMMTGLFVLLLVVALWLVPSTYRTLAHAEETLQEIDVISEAAVETLNAVSAAAGNVNKILADNAETMTDTMEKLNGLDFDTLNRAIQNLSDTVEPLARFFNAFKN